ncbi:MAG: hypothetical protein AB8H03_24040 [Saprospiraceae bacterium]
MSVVSLVLILQTCKSSSKKIIATGDMVSVSQSDNSFSDIVKFCIKNKKNILIDQPVDLKKGVIDIQNVGLNFSQKGLIRNGQLKSNGAKITSQVQKIFHQVKLQGDWQAKEGYLEWFVGKKIDNAQKNFLALGQLIHAGIKVHLLKKYQIASLNAQSYFDTPKPIIIFGKNKKDCGLTLITKHQNSFFAYFRTDKGNSLHLSNITIQTLDYLEKKYSSNEGDFKFVSSAYSKQFCPTCKPNVDFIKIENCNISGSIALANFASHSSNQSLNEFSKGNTIKKVKITDSNFHYCNAPFAFSNVGYDEVLFHKNKVKNFSSQFLTFAASGIDKLFYPSLYRQRKKITITDNRFENDVLLDIPKGRAMSTIVVKGGDGKLIFSNNKVLNLKSKSTDAVAHPYYFTCTTRGNAEVFNNTFRDVVSKGNPSQPACLVKQRGESNLYLHDNLFEITKEALVDIGVLRHKNQSLKEVSGKDFFIYLFWIGTSQELIKKYTIKNNIFKVPLINGSSEIWDVCDFRFEDNVLEIEHFGSSRLKNSIQKDNVLFSFRKRLDRPKTQTFGNFISQNNQITIGSADNNVLHFTQSFTGMQNGSLKKTDVNYNYQNVIYDDDFKVNNVTIGYALLDGKNQKIRSTINGKGAFGLEDAANANSLRPNAQQLEIDLEIRDYQNHKSCFPLTVLPEAKQKIQIQNNHSDQINILDFNNAFFLYNLKTSLPLSVQLEVDYMLSNNQKGKQSYEIIFGDLYRSAYCKNEKGKIISFSPIDKSGKKIIISGKRKEAPFELVFETGDFKQPGKLFFQKTKQVQKIKLSLKTQKEDQKGITPEEYKVIIRSRN